MWLFHFPFKLLRYGFNTCFPNNQIVGFQILWINLLSPKRFRTLKHVSVWKSVCSEPRNPFRDHPTKSISEWPVAVLQSVWCSDLPREKRVKLSCWNHTRCLSGFAGRSQWDLCSFIVQRWLTKVSEISETRECFQASVWILLWAFLFCQIFTLRFRRAERSQNLCHASGILSSVEHWGGSVDDTMCWNRRLWVFSGNVHQEP